jgi:zinc protease
MVLAIAAGCGSAGGLKYDLRLPEQRIVLDNHLRVVYLPDDAAGYVRVAMRYDVGVNEDPAGRSGLAHLVEHLLFELRAGGAGRPTLSARLRDATVANNAFTDHDSTEYWEIAAPDRLATVLELEAERLGGGCASIDETALRREREVVRNEDRQREAVSLARVAAALYPEDHPYRKPLSAADLDAITLADVCAFVHDFYVPQRATLVVAGDVTRAQLEAALTPMKVVSDRAGEPLRVVRPLEPMSEIGVVRGEKLRGVALGIPLHEDANEVDRLVADQVVAELQQRLRLTIVRLVGGKRAPVLLVWRDVPAKGDYEQAGRQLIQDLQNAMRDVAAGVTSMTRWRLLVHITTDLELIDRRAEWCADHEQLVAEPATLEDYLGGLNDMSPLVVRAMIDRLFDWRRLRIVVALPAAARAPAAAPPAGTIDDPRGDALTVDPGQAAAPLALPPLGSVPSIRSFTLANGARVVLWSHPGPVPVVAVALVFAAGSAHEPIAMPGVAALAAAGLAPPPGVAKLDGRDERLDSDLALLGATRSVRVDGELTAFVTRGVSPQAALLVAALARGVREGTYDDAWLERAVGAAPLWRTINVDITARMAVFGREHPYARTGYFVPTSLPRDPSPLAEFRARHYVARNLTLVVAGSFDVGQAEAAARKALADWPAGVAAPPVPPPAAAAGARHIALVADAPLVSARIAFRTAAELDEDRAARLILEGMLDARARRVRERFGAAYEAFARLEEHQAGGALMVGAEIDPARAAAAVAELRAGIEALRRGDDFREDFVRARRAVVTRMLLGSGGSGEIALGLAAMAIRGKPVGYGLELLRRIAAARPEDVRRVVERELAPGDEVIVLRGPREAIADAFARAGIGDVETLAE